MQGLQHLTQHQLARLVEEVQRAAAQQAIANLINQQELPSAFLPPTYGVQSGVASGQEPAWEPLASAMTAQTSQEAFFGPAFGLPRRRVCR